jgi:hypothetical protein
LSAGPFPVDEGLLASAADRLRAHPRLRFVMGGAGTGKSSVCLHLHESIPVAVIDMDTRIYGTWGDRWDRTRHPANSTWMAAADPLAWQLALDPEAFLRFHAAATVEALDLLADELAGTDDTVPTLVDGGFGSLAVVARAVPPASIVCLALPPGRSEAVWTVDPWRRGFLEMVAAIDTIDDPVARFLALDAALAERMVADATAAGVAVIERAPGTPLDVTAAVVAEMLALS